MAVTWIEYKGQNVLFSDYRGCKTGAEMLKILYDEVEILNSQEEKVLVMAHYDNCNPNGEYFHALKKVGKEVLKNKTKKTATLGITGMKRLLHNTYITVTGDYNIRLFKKQEVALEWLISKY